MKMNGEDMNKLNVRLGCLSLIVFMIFLIWTIITWGEPKSFLTGLACFGSFLMAMFCFGDISNDDYDGYYF